MKKVILARFMGILVVAILMLAGCATMGKSDAEPFKSAVTSVLDTYGATLKAGDVDGWIALWDENGIQLPPDAPAVVGKPAILQAKRGALLAIHFEQFTVNLEETQVSGYIGFARGTYSYTAVAKAGGGTVFFQGEFLTIFKRQPGGSWKIYRDCFNSSAPPQ